MLTIAMYIFWGLAEILIYPIAKQTTYWRDIVFYYILLPVLVINILSMFILETPRYLLNKDEDKAIKVLNKIAKINGNY